MKEQNIYTTSDLIQLHNVSEDYAQEMATARYNSIVDGIGISDPEFSMLQNIVNHEIM